MNSACMSSITLDPNSTFPSSIFFTVTTPYFSFLAGVEMMPGETGLRTIPFIAFGPAATPSVFSGARLDLPRL